MQEMTEERILEYLEQHPEATKKILSKFNLKTGKRRAAPPPSSSPLTKRTKIAQTREQAEAEARAARFALSRSQSANSAIFSSNSALDELKRKELQKKLDELKKDIEESQDKLLESHVSIENGFKELRKKCKEFLDKNMLLKGNISSAFAELQNNLSSIRQTFEVDNLDVLEKIANQNMNLNISTLRKQFDGRLETINKITQEYSNHVELIFKTVQLLTTLPRSELPSNINDVCMEFITNPMTLQHKDAIESMHQTLKNWLSTGNTPTTSKFPLLSRMFSPETNQGPLIVKQSKLDACEITPTHTKRIINFLLINLNDTVRTIYVAPGVIETATRNVAHYENKIKITGEQLKATTDKKQKERLQKKLEKQKNKKEEQEQLLKVLTENNTKYTTLYDLVYTKLKKPKNCNLLRIIYHFCKTKGMSEKFKQRRSREITEAKKQSIISDQELDNPTESTAKKFVDRIRHLCDKIVIVKKPDEAAEPAAPSSPAVNKKLKTD